MKKFFSILLVLILVFAMVACSNDEEDTPTTDPIITDDGDMEKDEPVDDMEQEEPSTEDKIANLSFKEQNLKIQATYEAEGYSTEMTQYLVDGDIRIDLLSPEGSFSLLMMKEENTMYMLNETQSLAYRMELDSDANTGILGSVETIEAYQPDQILDMFSNYSFTTLDGEEVLYFESSEMEGMVKVWISTTYGYPLRMELSDGDTMIMSMKATITEDFEIQDLFSIPADYEMMDMMNMMDEN